MCLVISVELFGVPKSDAQLFTAQQRANTIDLRFDGMTGLFNRGNPRVSLSERGKGCACSMLTDDADWNAATWDLREDVVSALADTLTTIHRHAGNGFAFEGLWIGDRPKTDQRNDRRSCKPRERQSDWHESKVRRCCPQGDEVGGHSSLLNQRLTSAC